MQAMKDLGRLAELNGISAEAVLCRLLKPNYAIVWLARGHDIDSAKWERVGILDGQPSVVIDWRTGSQVIDLGLQLSSVLADLREWRGPVRAVLSVCYMATAGVLVHSLARTGSARLSCTDELGVRLQFVEDLKAFSEGDWL